MLEVVFSRSVPEDHGGMIGHMVFRAEDLTSVIISDGDSFKRRNRKFQASGRRSGAFWLGEMLLLPLEGNRGDIVNLPLALSQGNISGSRNLPGA